MQSELFYVNQMTSLIIKTLHGILTQPRNRGPSNIKCVWFLINGVYLADYVMLVSMLHVPLVLTCLE